MDNEKFVSAWCDLVKNLGTLVNAVDNDLSLLGNLLIEDCSLFRDLSRDYTWAKA